jgi:hypothetical protein
MATALDICLIPGAAAQDRGAEPSRGPQPVSDAGAIPSVFQHHILQQNFL